MCQNDMLDSSCALKDRLLEPDQFFFVFVFFFTKVVQCYKLQKAKLQSADMYISWVTFCVKIILSIFEIKCIFHFYIQTAVYDF